MAVVVDTTEVPPAERFDLWAEVSAQVFEPLAVSQSAQGPFSARLEHHGLGPVGLFHMWADASAADRTVSLIRSRDPELMEIMEIMLQLDGECSITQDGRSSVVRPGELTSWHSSKPYCVAGRTSFEAVMVYMPVVLLRPHVDRVLRRTAMGIDGESGVGAIVRQYVRGLLGGVQDGSLAEASRAHLAEGLLDLVRALLVGPEREAAPSTTDGMRARISDHRTRTSPIRASARRASRASTSSRAATSTGCSGTRDRACRRRSAAAGWSASGATWRTPPSRTRRSSTSPRAGAS